MSARVLLAGIGNLFHGDDGFGPEVVRRLVASGDLPEGVRAVDYGIRGMHLAYDLLDGYDALVIIDAVPGSGLAGELAVADAAGLERFHLLGISMGGAIAQEVALAAPERVRTLTLTVTFAGGGAWARALARVWSARVREMPRERHIDELLLLNLSEEFYENEAAVQFARDLSLRNPHPQDPDGFARQLAASSAHDATDRLAGLSVPTHVIGGERDILVPVWKSVELAGLIPGARLTVLERAPHGLSLERAEEYNHLVLAFLAEHDRAAA